ncbi:surface-adhesin E family protein [Caulobacter sp. LARHSG274]
MKVVSIAVAAMIAAIPISALAGDFWVIGGGKKGPELADADSIKTVGELKSLTTVTILNAPQSFYGGRMIRRQNIRWMIDCQTRSYQHVGFDLVSGTGEVLSPNDVKTDWSHAVSGTIGDKMVKIACDGVPTDQAVGHYTDINVAQAEWYAVLQKN